MPQSPLVSIKNLTFRRGSRLIFDDISFDVPQGAIVGIMGPSGTGKTTLLNLIAAQLKPTIGEIIVSDQDFHTLSKKALYLARQRIGMLFQSGALFTDMSTFDNVAFPLRENTLLPESMIRDIVLMKLEAVGLRGAKNLMPNELSGGMARRVALARAIALDPQLMMYDEPFTGLDPIAKAIIVQLIKKLNQALGTTSILVSHDIEEICSICDTLVIVASGKIVGQGSPEEMRSSADPEVKQFILGLPDGKIPFQYPAPDYKKEILTT